MQARHYDPFLARWFGIDLLSESYFDYSPYAYVGNSPLFFADPTVLGWVRNGEETIWNSNVNTQEDATYFYGEESEFLAVGTTYMSESGNFVILADNGEFSISGKSYISIDHKNNTNLAKSFRDIRKQLDPDGKFGFYMQYEGRLGLVFEGSGSIDIIITRDGEVGVYENVTFGVGLIEAATTGWALGFTIANNLDDFAGWGANAGAFANAGLGIGASGAIEGSIMFQGRGQDSTGRNLTEFSMGVTAGVPVSAGVFGEGLGIYVEGAYTWVQPCVNLAEAFRILNSSRNKESKVQSFDNAGRLKPWEPKF